MKNLFILVAAVLLLSLTRFVYADGMVIPSPEDKSRSKRYGGEHVRKEEDKIRIPRSHMPSAGDSKVTLRISNNIYEPGQRALIKKYRDTETMILQIKVMTSVDDFGWIIPVPSYPKVSIADANIFNELENFSFTTQSEMAAPITALEPPDDSTWGSYVDISTENVGIYEVNKIRARNSMELFEWMNEYGFTPPPGSKSVIDEYVKKGFSFIAMRVNVDNFEQLNKDKSDYLRGWLDPIKIEFKSKEYFFPMKLTSLNPGSTFLTLWVLASSQMEFAGAVTQWADYISPGILKKAGLVNLAREAKGAKFITQLTRNWESNRHIQADLIISKVQGLFGLIKLMTPDQRRYVNEVFIAFSVVLALWLPRRVMDAWMRRYWRMRRRNRPEIQQVRIYRKLKNMFMSTSQKR